MPATSRVTTARCVTVWGAATLAAVVLLAWVRGGVGAALTGAATADFAALLGAWCAVAAALATLWLWVQVSAGVWEALRSRADGPSRWRAVGPVRRWALVACGVAVLAPAAPLAAHAGPAEPAAVPRPQSAASAVVPTPTAEGRDLLHGLPSPDRAEGGAGRSRLPREEADGRVVVAPGECLWSIARRHLGPAAGDAEVARYVARVHAASPGLDTDPDLVLPGQVLHLPPSPTTAPGAGEEPR